MSAFLYVANWKMERSCERAIAFAQEHKDRFERLAGQDDIEIVVCPSFDALYPVSQMFKNSSVFVGAQNCSAHELGAHTGQVAVESLVDLECRACIVGHSECRTDLGESDELIAKKIERLLLHDVIPTVCVGETRQEYEQKKTKAVIERQVASACNAVARTRSNAALCIVYEPVWAIGTGDVPANEYIQGVFENIRSLADSIVSEAEIALLYGGSVSETNAAELKKINDCGGFLIGGASLDFQKFEKIVT